MKLPLNQTSQRDENQKSEAPTENGNGWQGTSLEAIQPPCSMHVSVLGLFGCFKPPMDHGEKNDVPMTISKWSYIYIVIYIFIYMYISVTIAPFKYGIQPWNWLAIWVNLSHFLNLWVRTTSSPQKKRLPKHLGEAAPGWATQVMRAWANVTVSC